MNSVKNPGMPNMPQNKQVTAFMPTPADGIKRLTSVSAANPRTLPETIRRTLPILDVTIHKTAVIPKSIAA